MGNVGCGSLTSVRGENMFCINIYIHSIYDPLTSLLQAWFFCLYIHVSLFCLFLPYALYLEVIIVPNNVF